MKNKLLGFFFLEGNDLYIVKFDELSLVKHKLYVPHLRGRVYSGQTKSQWPANFLHKENDLH